MVRFVELRSTCSHGGDALFTQRLRVNGHLRRRAHEDCHIARLVSLIDELAESHGDMVRLGFRSLRRCASFVHGQGEFDARCASLVVSTTSRGLQIEEILDEEAGPAADASHEGEDVSMAAEIVLQLYHECACFSHIGLVFQVYLDVGSLEAVDALLGVADRAEMCMLGSRNAFDHVDLQLAGVLEFIDHDELEALRILLGDFRVLVEGLEGGPDQAAGIDHRFCMQDVPIVRVNLSGEFEKQVYEPASLVHVRLIV